MGAGCIFVSRDVGRVKGLTTAATIWLVAAIGIACGAGLLAIAVIATALALIVLVVLRYLEKLLIPRQFASKQLIIIEAAHGGGQLIGQAYDILTRASISVEKLEIQAERALRVAHRQQHL